MFTRFVLSALCLTSLAMHACENPHQAHSLHRTLAQAKQPDLGLKNIGKDYQEKPSLLVDLHEVCFDYTKLRCLTGLLWICVTKPKIVYQAYQIKNSPEMQEHFKKLKAANVKVNEAYLEPLKDSNPEVYETICTFLTDIFKPNNEMESYLREFKDQGHKIYMLSNIGPALLDKLKAKYPRYFTVFSSNENLINHTHTPNTPWLNKPHPAAFQHALKKIGKLNQAASCIFIDDKKENTTEAQKVGLHGIHFKSPKQFKKDVQKLTKQIQNNSRIP